jgi:membrane associated rhomboid family serine protease
MSWYDREYARDEGSGYGLRRSVYRGSGLSIWSASSTILWANIIVYLLLNSLNPRIADQLESFGVMQADAVLHGQVWRLLTATYLHANFGHIFMNMLGLYFLGPWLERVWGRRQFLLVYTLGGVAGNVLLTLAGLLRFMNPYTFGVGASGSILTLLGAAAVLFPEAEVFVYFLLPVRIRTAAIIFAVGYVWNVLHKGANYGGDICHLAGLGVGVWWAYSGGVSLSGRHRSIPNPASLSAQFRSWIGRTLRRGPQKPSWRQRQEEARTDEETVDRILAKVYNGGGVHCLTPEEKRALTEASERQRAREARAAEQGKPR